MAQGVLAMNVLLSHIDMAPVFYGVLLLIGVYSLMYKLMRGNFVAFAVELGVFYIVFKMHGGTVLGGLSAAICALLVGLTFKLFVRIVMR